MKNWKKNLIRLVKYYKDKYNLMVDEDDTFKAGKLKKIEETISIVGNRAWNQISR